MSAMTGCIAAFVIVTKGRFGPFSPIALLNQISAMRRFPPTKMESDDV